ncbi:uncharacterized protein LOC128896753 [Hylaeus anthracinus]|uniref:uncharacterized protein LOC128896753 n=1 Tax=Hylaeus anthracinus TaxID=313031 RepID=UPI0023BA10BE|nr:uncharacterized protein LOC128896753 [Hylaeus anthracinus]
MATEDEVWAQTLITVTPEEDATLREISDTTVLSSTPDVPLSLDDKIVYRRSFTHRQFIDSNELDQVPSESDVEAPEESLRRPMQDAENQTYLQGTPIVQISLEYRDEASQTMYMRPPCLPLTYYKDIMTSMHESSMPTLKKSMATATIVTFHPNAPENAVSIELSTNIPENDLEEFVSELTSKEQAEIETSEILNFLIARALWIIDPSKIQTELQEKEVQTCIKFNCHTNTLVVDRETQTALTCEPKKSNTTLLSNYWETKNIVSSILEDCLSKGIGSRIAINYVMEDIIDQCADRIRYPMVDQSTQTIVTYPRHREKEEDILRKLRVDIVVDPLEASVVVAPLIDNLLQRTSDTVSRNAPAIVKNILEKTLKRTMTIVGKLMELEQESQPTQISQILEQRRKKILDSMLHTKTEAMYTQTNIAGIVEVRRIKDERDVVCSVCRRPSTCKWCTGDYKEKNPEVTMLRTKDILLAYKPCYVMTTASEKETTIQTQTNVIYPPSPRVAVSKHSTKESEGTISIFLQPEIGSQKSVNEWSCVIDATLMKPCSMKESLSNTNETTASSDKSSLKSGQDSYCEVLTSQAANALEILKNTFCSRENCLVTSQHSLKKSCVSMQNVDTCEKSTCLNKSSSAGKTSTQDTFYTQNFEACSKLRLRATRTCIKRKAAKSRGFKIIPICLLQNSDSQE